MKVSKPIIIFAVVVLLMAGYIFFFTGKKKTSVVTPVQPTTGQTQQVPATGQRAQAQSPPGAVPMGQAKTGDADTAVSAAKPRLDKLDIGWVRNPFLLPLFKDERKKVVSTAIRLVAVLEKGDDRVAVIDREVVRKGDMVGDERVLDIGRDSVVLARNGIKRVLNLMSFDDTVREEEPKSKVLEKGK